MNDKTMFRAPDGETIRVSLLEGGHTAIITDQWRELDARFHRAALAQGAIRAVPAGAAEDPAPPPPPHEGQTNEPTHEGLVRRALIQMLERSQDGDFTGAGLPDLRIVRGLAGINADRDLIYGVWAKLKTEADAK